jgi:hypothetical protein
MDIKGMRILIGLNSSDFGSVADPWACCESWRSIKVQTFLTLWGTFASRGGPGPWSSLMSELNTLTLFRYWFCNNLLLRVQGLRD